MGCASSAPLVQQGLDAARKAVSRDTVEEKTKSMAKDVIESDQTKGILESVSKAKDEAVEKIEEFGETVKEKAENLVEEIEEKVESVIGSSKEKAEEVKEDVTEAVEAFDGMASEEASKEPIPETALVTTPDLTKEGDLNGSPATTVAETTMENRYECSHTPEIWTRTETISPSGSSELREIKQEIEQDLLAMGVAEVDQEEDLDASRGTENSKEENVNSAGEDILDEEEKPGVGQTPPSIDSSDVVEIGANVEINVEEYNEDPPDQWRSEENSVEEESSLLKDENILLEGNGEEDLLQNNYNDNNITEVDSEEIIETTEENLNENEEIPVNEDADNVIIDEETSNEKEVISLVEELVEGNGEEELLENNNNDNNITEVDSEEIIETTEENLIENEEIPVNEDADNVIIDEETSNEKEIISLIEESDSMNITEQTENTEKLEEGVENEYNEERKSCNTEHQLPGDESNIIFGDDEINGYNNEDLETSAENIQSIEDEKNSNEINSKENLNDGKASLDEDQRIIIEGA